MRAPKKPSCNCPRAHPPAPRCAPNSAPFIPACWKNPRRNWPPAACIRRRPLEEAGGWREGPFPEDYDLWLRLTWRYEVGLVDEPLVIKRGEYGALMIDRKSMFGTPAYPLEHVVDPTGAGDSFAGGFVGYLAAAKSCDPPELRKAVVFGSVMASFNVSEFGPRRLAELTFSEIEARYREFRALTNFGDL